MFRKWKGAVKYIIFDFHELSPGQYFQLRSSVAMPLKFEQKISQSKIFRSYIRWKIKSPENTSAYCVVPLDSVQSIQT